MFNTWEALFDKEQVLKSHRRFTFFNGPGDNTWGVIVKCPKPSNEILFQKRWEIECHHQLQFIAMEINAAYLGDYNSTE